MQCASPVRAARASRICSCARAAPDRNLSAYTGLSLLYFGCLFPDSLPAPVAFLIRVGVPKAPAWYFLTSDDDFDLRLVANHRRLAVDPYVKRLWLPYQKVDRAGGYLPKKLVFWCVLPVGSTSWKSSACSWRARSMFVATNAPMRWCSIVRMRSASAWKLDVDPHDVKLAASVKITKIAQRRLRRVMLSSLWQMKGAI